MLPDTPTRLLQRLRNPWLRRINQVGRDASWRGAPFFYNDGRITIGDKFSLSSRPIQSHIVAAKGAVIEIHDCVSISYGAAISAQRAIRIGSNTRIGPFVVIIDSDFHRPGDRDSTGDKGPVTIGANVEIGARVTILRGAGIRDGARIAPGSMVAGVVARGAIVSGVPARATAGASPRKQADSGKATGPDVAQLVQEVLGLKQRPELRAESDAIPEWDSLGALRLLIAIEETYQISVREADMRSVRTVGALAELVSNARKHSRATARP
jgi:acetyltransferase-like isoleucine patch superfamily enzyme/acyl carrier protein